MDRDLASSAVQIVGHTLNEPFLRRVYIYLSGIGSGTDSVEWSTSTRHAPGQQMRFATISRRAVHRTGDSCLFVSSLHDRGSFASATDEIRVGSWILSSSRWIKVFVADNGKIKKSGQPGNDKFSIVSWKKSLNDWLDKIMSSTMKITSTVSDLRTYRIGI